MTTSIPLSDLESTPAAKFDKIGDAYRGRIVDMDHRQQTDTEGKLLYWNDQSPRMLWVFTIEQDNGDRVALYAKGGKYAVAEGSGESMGSAITTAARNAQASAIDMGADLAVALTGFGERTSKGGTPKLYTAQYRARPPSRRARPSICSTTDP
jgi:hypothetical protein